jgi:hypothetical protein
MKEFYLTLPSNASHHLYPLNSLSSFKINIPRTVQLEGDWSVGLSEIHFVNDFDNITEDNGFVMRLYTGKQYFTIESKLKAGRYRGLKDVIESINNLIVFNNLDADFSKYVKAPDRALYFTYDDLTGYAAVVINQPDLSIVLKGDLAHCLGFEDAKTYSQTKKATRIADIDVGFHGLYVYSDIIEPQLVGDSIVPLLRVVDFSKRSEGNIAVIYKTPHYIPLIRKTFENIEIHIRRDDGRSASFRRGKTVVVLHFTQR